METPELSAERIDYLVLLSDKLATKYPELNARLQRAVSIVRAGGVQLRGDDLAAVANGGEAPYEVTGEGCACEDFARGNAPRGMCKHRLAVHLLRQTHDHFDPDTAASPAPQPGDPEPVPSIGTRHRPRPEADLAVHLPGPEVLGQGRPADGQQGRKGGHRRSPPGGRSQVQGRL